MARSASPSRAWSIFCSVSSAIFCLLLISSARILLDCKQQKHSRANNHHQCMRLASMRSWRLQVTPVCSEASEHAEQAPQMKGRRKRTCRMLTAAASSRVLLLLLGHTPLPCHQQCMHITASHPHPLSTRRRACQMDTLSHHVCHTADLQNVDCRLVPQDVAAAAAESHPVMITGLHTHQHLPHV